MASATKAKNRLVQLNGHIGASSKSPIKSYDLAARILRLQDAVTIITGASSPMGIGCATAHRFAAQGARAIYLCDFRSDHLSEHKSEIRKRYPGTEVHIRTFDAADETSVKAVVSDAITQYNRLDVFFANAGIVGTNQPFGEIEASVFMDIIRTNTLSVFLAIKYAAPAMRQVSATKLVAGGSIVATASVAGLRSNAGSSDYSASKAAVINLVQTAAFQLAGTGVRVNAVLPGLIETGMTEKIFEDARRKGIEHKVGQLNPAKRGGSADEVAAVALFLASSEASYVNGQACAVDGGLSAGLPFVPGRLA